MDYRLLRCDEIHNVEPCVSLCQAEAYLSYVIVGLTLMFLRNSEPAPSPTLTEFVPMISLA